MPSRLLLAALLMVLHPVRAAPQELMRGLEQDVQRIGQGDEVALDAVWDRYAELRRLVLEDSTGARVTTEQIEVLILAATVLADPATYPPELLDRLPAREEVIDLLLDAEAAATVRGDARTEAAVQYRLAVALRDGGRLGEASEVLLDALDSSPAGVLRGALLLDLAQLALYRGEYGAAEDWLQQAEEELLPGEPQYDRRRCTLLGLQGQRLLALGLPDQARPCFAAEQELARRLNDVDLLRTAARHDAGWRFSLQDFAAVIEVVEEVLAQDQAGQWAVDEGPLRSLLGRAQAELERTDATRPREAAATLRATLALPSLRRTDRLATRLALAEVEIREGLLAAAQALLAAAQDDLQQLQEAEPRRPLGDEAVRWVTLRARLQEAGGPGDEQQLLADLGGALAELQRQWSSVPDRPGGIGFLRYGVKRRDAVSAWLSLLVRVHGEEGGIRQAAVGLLDMQALGSLARRLGAQPGSLEAVQQRLLEPGRGLLWYFIATERSHLLIIEQDRVAHVELAGLDVLVPRWRDALAHVMRSPGVLESASARTAFLRARDLAVARLSAQLLPPPACSRLSAWDEVYVAGTNLLGHVPFEWLTVAAGEQLGQSHAVAHLPSVSVGLHLLAQVELSQHVTDLLLVGAPRPAESVLEGWPQLRQSPLSEEDLVVLSEPLTDFTVTVAAGPDATRGRLDRGGSAGALHLLTHGIYAAAGGRERPAALVLTPEGEDDGLLWCEEAEQVRAPPLVVLSACGAARGPLRPGDDGVQHLGGAFLQAGARSVVLSYAALEQNATVALMKVFHERLLRHGDAPARALQQARLALSRDTRRGDPFYHSLVYVLGVGHERLFPGRPAAGAARVSAPVLLVAAAAAGLVILLLLRQRRRR